MRSVKAHRAAALLAGVVALLFAPSCTGEPGRWNRTDRSDPAAPADPALIGGLIRGATWSLTWDTERVSRVEDGGWSVDTDRGYRVHVELGWLTTYSVSLGLCDAAVRAAMAAPAGARSGAFSGCDRRMRTRMATPRPWISSTPRISPGASSRTGPGPRRSRRRATAGPLARGARRPARRLARRDRSPGSEPGPRGRWERDGVRGDLAVSTWWPQGYLVDLDAAAPDDGEAKIAQITVKRSLGSLFDGIDLASATDEQVAGSVLENLALHAESKVELWSLTSPEAFGYARSVDAARPHHVEPPRPARPLVTAALLGLGLVATAWTAYRGAEALAETVSQGQAERLLEIVRVEGTGRGEPPRSAAFASVLADHAGEGLRAVALLDPSGRVVASVGELSPVPLSDKELGPGARFVASAIACAWSLRARRRIRRRRSLRVGLEASSSTSSARVRYSSAGPRVRTEPRGRARTRATRTLISSAVAAALLVGAAGIFVRRARRADELTERLAQSERLASLGTMSAVLAHEIKNPLAALKGNAQLLVEGLDNGTRQRAQADRVVSAAVRLQGLVDNLLDFARSGGLDRAPLDPGGDPPRGGRGRRPARRARSRGRPRDVVARRRAPASGAGEPAPQRRAGLAGGGDRVGARR